MRRQSRACGTVLATAMLLAAGPPAYADDDVVIGARGDATGYQLLKAKASEGWTWRPITTIQPGGDDSDEWTGYHCVTSDGRWIVSVVAPRSAANHPVARDRGAVAYVTGIASGRTRPLAAGVALKYHSPGCGTGGRAVLTRSEGTDQARTTLLVANLESAKVTRRVAVRGQLTSATLAGDGRLMAVAGKRIVRVQGTRLRTLRRVDGLPFQLLPSRTGIDFLVARSGATQVWRMTGARTWMVAAGKRGAVKLFQGRAGTNVVVGAKAAGLRSARAPLGASARTASLAGGVVLAEPARARGTTGRAAHGPTTRHAELYLTDARSGRSVGRQLKRQSSIRFTALPAAPRRVTARASVNTTTPKCAVPRNDLRRQVPQPNAAQINWAIQQATRNLLQGSVLTRPANFLNAQLVAYQPSLDFPRRDLRGYAGVPIPPSVMQAVFAQESAWRHASLRALPGESGNPLVGDYYGSEGTLDQIDYDEADCGYGVTQVTDPMTVAATAYSTNGKTKVAIDYAENIAAGTQFLVDKWNQLYDAGVLANGGNPAYLENWYFAIWAYNTGFHPSTGSGPWGLGWTNNPRNGDYPPDRDPFLRTTYADAEHPADWPYQERVIGWMETPLLDYKGNAAYQAVGPVSLPPINTFCTVSNDCSPTYHDPSRPPDDDSLDYCTRSDRKCWWHGSTTWATCPSLCNTSVFTVATNATEPANDNNFPPACNSTLGSTAIIVDEQPSNLNTEGCASVNWTSAGTFAVQYGTNTASTPLGVIDWHQLGTGFGGHTWFTKNRNVTDTAHINTGTWTPPPLNGIYNVRVHIPPSGASTSQASYTIHRGNGTSREVTINQHLHENRWESLGNYTLQSGAKVVLTNVTPETPGTANVAFDAMAFVAVTGTPVRRVVDATTTFDPNQSLNTDLTDSKPFGSGLINFTPFNNMQNIYDWGMALTDTAGLPGCTGTPTPSCVGPDIAATLSALRTRVTTAGNTRQVPEAADTQPRWLAFASPRPPSVMTDVFRGDPDNYKVRARVVVEFLQSGGVIDPGSITVTQENKTGNTHLPEFVLDFMHAIRDDYGIIMPDLSYQAQDLLEYTHAVTSVDTVANGGTAPGRAFKFYMTPAQMNSTDTCVSVQHISGGTIGTKPLNHNPAVNAAVVHWRDQVADLVTAGTAPAIVGHVAQQIYRAFFRWSEFVPVWSGTADANSVFHVAPPIWIQLDVKVCANGTVSPIRDQLAYSSYMPDLYLWLDNQRVDLYGSPTSGPAQLGDFVNFSHPSTDWVPGPMQQPWLACQIDPSGPNFAGRRNGQPWTYAQTTHNDEIKNYVRLCDASTYYPPDYHYDE